MKQLYLFIELTRLKRPIGYMLLFWPCAWGLSLAYDFSNGLNTYFFYNKGRKQTIKYFKQKGVHLIKLELNENDQFNLKSILKKVNDLGIKNLLVICPGFASDCVETLEEINIEGRHNFLAAGGEEFNYIPCLNYRKDWVKALNHLSKK